MLDFHSYPLWVDIAVFAASAAAVWLAGTRLSRQADAFSRITGIGGAVVGLILLGGITSLPEVAVSTSSSLNGNAALAVNNLLGGVAMQVAVLAIADAAIGRDPLTSVVAKPIILLQGTLCVVLLVLVASGIVVGEVSILGVGVWTSGVLVMYVVAMWLITWSEGRRTWLPGGGAQNRQQEPSGGAERARAEEASLGSTVVKMAVAGLTILMAGFLLSRTGEAIADKTGLGSSFVGAVFLAISTSLPEVSTVLSAVRLKRYEMAVSDIFGTNLFDIVLVFLVDAVYAGRPVLAEVGPFSTFAALLGIAVTTIYLAGLVERRDKAILRMGVDSLAVLGTYVGGLGILYSLR
ncbi:MAG TPA: sodium:calcium antiporter [Alphaproteobacteria bacterium]|nr:sodium:calcium antiporter [Alphaproteobacteria bacterium]